MNWILIKNHRFFPMAVFLIPFLMWVGLWFSLNAGPLSHLTNFRDLFVFLQGVRGAFPILCSVLVVLIIFTNPQRIKLNKWILVGPLGFMSLYGLAGIIASVMSPDASVSLYWSVMYLSVPLVLLLIMQDINPLDRISTVLRINWTIMLVALFIVYLFALIKLDFDAFILQPSVWFKCHEHTWFDDSGQLLRSTSVGRYAAIAGLICLGQIWVPKWRYFGIFGFIAAIVMLFYAGSRTPLIAFGAALPIFAVFYAGKKIALAILLGLFFVLPIIWFTGMHRSVLDDCLFRGEMPDWLYGPASRELSLVEEKVENTSLSINAPVTAATFALEKVHGFFGTGKGRNEIELGKWVFVSTETGEEIIFELSEDGNIRVMSESGNIADQSNLSGDDTSFLIALNEGTFKKGETSIDISEGEWWIHVDLPNLENLEDSTLLEGSKTEGSKTEGSKTVRNFLIEEPEIEEPVSAIVVHLYVPLSGRSSVWQEGLKLFWESPILGYGFHADRLKLNAHMHNSLLHAMVQTGLVGTIPFVTALILGWIALIKVFIVRHTLPLVHRHLVVQACALLMFLSLRTIPESTGAFFGVDLLLLIPILLYLYIVSVNYGGADYFKFRLPQKLVW